MVRVIGVKIDGDVNVELWAKWHELLIRTDDGNTVLWSQLERQALLLPVWKREERNF